MSENEKEKETKEENKRLPIVANGRGLALRTMDDMWRFACAVRDSGLAPDSFQKPDQILIAIQSGAELGMPPMRSLQSFCVVHGNARLWGDAPLALVRQSGLMEYIKERIEGEGENMVAICETKRKSDPEPVVTEFSVQDAKTAKLWGKAGTWQQYPKRMLKYRARSFNLRDNFPDAFGGATIAEEFEGVEMPDQAPTPQVPSREERKQVDAEVKDTQEVINTELADLINGFGTQAEFLLETKKIEPGILKGPFGRYAGFVLGDKDTDYTKAESFDLAKIALIKAHFGHEGIPDDILHLIPVPLTPKEAEEHLADKLDSSDFEYACSKCSHEFNEPKTSGKAKTKICPKCLSKNIEHFTEKVEVINDQN